jgi:hypothetical protein
MSDDAKKDAVSRRGFLGMGSAALAAAGDRQNSKEPRRELSLVHCLLRL